MVDPDHVGTFVRKLNRSKRERNKNAHERVVFLLQTAAQREINILDEQSGTEKHAAELQG
jgi:hypothetical protein